VSVRSKVEKTLANYPKALRERSENAGASYR